MILDCKKYLGPCDCGRDHELRTKLVVCEYGALKNFDKYMADCGLTGFRLEARFPYHGSGAMTRSPSPLAWRPDFPGAPREAH